MTRYLIIGNGAAGTEAAREIRRADAAGSVVMISASKYPHYWRPRLVHYLAEDSAPSSLTVYDRAWYAERDIATVLGREIRSLDVQSGRATDSAGTIWEYDKLLIATGSRPSVPPVAGIDRPGVFTLRSLTDADRIKAYFAGIDDVAVIGGGLLGLENAWSALRLGKRVTVVEYSPWLLPRQLDREGGARLQALLEGKGMRFAMGAEVAAIEGDGPGSPSRRVRLRSGQAIAAGAVIVSVGIRSDLRLASGTPIATNRGIAVDDFLSTSVPGVWAAGDVAEHRGTCYGLWTVAREQGRIAGLNMAGVETPYRGSVPSTLLKITGIDVFSMGDVNASENAGIGHVFGRTMDSGYRKVVTDESGKPSAAMVVGDKKRVALARDIMDGRKPPEDFLEDGDGD